MNDALTADRYRVELEAYSGPLDLLLYLVKRHEIDLHDIPIATLTEQYLTHLKTLEIMNVEHAGEFLVMAATLVEIKSLMLLPRPEDDQDATDAAEDPTDPRYELVQQLLAYKRFKDAANTLEQRQQSWAQRFPARPKKQQATPDDQAEAMDYELEDVQALDLCAAFARVLESIGQSRTHDVTYDDTPIALHAADIVDRLKREAEKQGAQAGEAIGLTLRQLFEGRTNRSELIGLFLATLELVRQNRVTVTHGDDSDGQAGDDVLIALRPPQEGDDGAGDDEIPAGFGDDFDQPQTGGL